ncbi:hypothetical protein OHA77_04430 [Streptosporangium sp. NBC_01639]|nr:hypothetical protein OHA77_04430 [Streptosporangium sp. NBC_01639]
MDAVEHTAPPQASPPCYWTDGPPVLDIEAALDHIVTMADQLQANHRESG